MVEQQERAQKPTSLYKMKRDFALVACSTHKCENKRNQMFTLRRHSPGIHGFNDVAHILNVLTRSLIKILHLLCLNQNFEKHEKQIN